MMIMAMFMLVIFNSCENDCEETSTLAEQVSVHTFIRNVSYKTLKDITVYGYKHYCDGTVHHTVVNLGWLPEGSTTSTYMTFNLSNTEDKVIIKVVATGVDANGDEFKREESRTFRYDDFDYGGISLEIGL